MSFKIYGLFDPNTDDIKYIGKTITQLNDRLNNHVYKAKSKRSSAPVAVWIRKILQNNKRPIIKLIQEYSDEFDWAICEIKWINHFNKMGHDLLNKAEGGGGNHIKVHLNDDIIAMLGNYPDKEVADKVGVSRKTISNYRRKLNIKSCPKHKYRYNPHSKGKPAHNRHMFSKDIVNKMGKISDKEVARLAGVDRKTVEKFRHRNNISAYVMSGEDHHNAKLNKKEIIEIKEKISMGNKPKDVAIIYHVSVYTIYDIINNRSWND